MRSVPRKQGGFRRQSVKTRRMLNNLPRTIQMPGQHRSHSEKALYSSYMDHWHGFGPTLNILQIYESTIVDNEPDHSEGIRTCSRDRVTPSTNWVCCVWRTFHSAA